MGFKATEMGTKSEQGLSHSRTSSFRSLLRVTLRRLSLVSRPLVKGNEDAGYEGGP